MGFEQIPQLKARLQCRLSLQTKCYSVENATGFQTAFPKLNFFHLKKLFPIDLQSKRIWCVCMGMDYSHVIVYSVALLWCNSERCAVEGMAFWAHIGRTHAGMQLPPVSSQGLKVDWSLFYVGKHVYRPFFLQQTGGLSCKRSELF